MKFIGNIVSEKEIIVNNRFNLVKSYDDIISELPTLVVGYELISELNPDFNILKNKINDKLFWSFGKNENRDKFNRTMVEFIYYSFNLAVKDVNFIYVDPIHFSPNKLNKISKKISELKNPIGVIKDDRVIYIYGENLIFSFDLDICELADIKKESLRNKYNKLVNGFLDYESIFIEYGNDIAALNDSIRYLLFLYSMDNG